MYLKQAWIENSGPIKQLHLALPFTHDGLPKPVILVGSNGSGKTNLLSLVTDSLFEIAAVHYSNALPGQAATQRPWFRIIGARTISAGSTGGFSVLAYEDECTTQIYKEKGGTIDVQQARNLVPEELKPKINWANDANAVKKVTFNDERSRIIFEQGVYAYFPSSRSEAPYWLNREVFPDAEFEASQRFTKRLHNPIYVEHGLHQFKQWLMSVILEARIHIQVHQNPLGQQISAVGNPNEAVLAEGVLSLCNQLLRLVLDDEEVRFVWLGRKSPDKVAVAKGNALLFPTLESLSGGQSTLLGIFGTLLRYADFVSGNASIDGENVTGICVIDEIDAHIHIDLQYKVLPRLIKLFPKVQFILSSHSPIFALGMEREFGCDGLDIVEMPSGAHVSGETYSEFKKAFEAMAATDAFSQSVLTAADLQGKPIVFVEGETDPSYLKKAAHLLGRKDLLEKVDIEWIGAKDPKGQGFHTGHTALDHTLAVLLANPHLVKRKILLLYDNDIKKDDVDYESISVRRMPSNANNKKIKSGIENLLLEESITDGDYKESINAKDGGDIVTVKSLQKMSLCSRLCDGGAIDDFKGMAVALDLIQAFLE